MVYIDNTHRKAGKINVMDYDAMLDLPDDTCLYCLSARDVQIILSQMEYVGWKTRYFSAIGTPVSQDTIDGWQVSIQGALMSDVCAQIFAKLQEIRDEETHIHDAIENLGTEISIEHAAQDVALGAIATDVTGISAALALLSTAVAGIAALVTTINGTVNTINANTDTLESSMSDALADLNTLLLLVQKIKGGTVIINNTVNVIVQTLITFSSSTEDTTSTEQYARYNALCSAVVNWMYSECYVVLEALTAPAPDLATIRGVLDAYALSMLYVLTPNVPPYTVSTIYAAFSDTSAVNDVACAIITNLANLAVDQVNFAAALASYTPPALPDARKVIFDTLQLALADFDAYQTFVSILPTAYQSELALVPTSYNCPPCTPGLTVPKTWDFKSTGAKDIWLIIEGQMVAFDGIDAGIRAVPMQGPLIRADNIWLEATWPALNLSGYQCRITGFYSYDRDGNTAPGNDQLQVTFSTDTGSGCSGFVSPSTVAFSPGTAGALQTVTFNCPTIGNTCGLKIFSAGITRRWYIEKIEIF